MTCFFLHRPTFQLRSSMIKMPVELSLISWCLSNCCQNLCLKASTCFLCSVTGKWFFFNLVLWLILLYRKFMSMIYCNILGLLNIPTSNVGQQDYVFILNVHLRLHCGLKCLGSSERFSQNDEGIVKSVYTPASILWILPRYYLPLLSTHRIKV